MAQAAQEGRAAQEALSEQMQPEAQVVQAARLEALAAWVVLKERMVAVVVAVLASCRIQEAQAEAVPALVAIPQYRVAPRQLLSYWY